MPVSMPPSRRRLTTYEACHGAGSRVSRSRTKSIPRNNPEPRTSPIKAWRTCKVFKHIQHCEACCASDWVAAKRAEKLHPVVKRIGNFRRGDDCRERKCIPDRLAKNHDVRNDALRLEPPEMRSQTPESHLHFVSDANRVRPAHVTI